MTRFCPKCQVETERNKKGDCKPCGKAYKATWSAANRDKLNAKSAAWKAANPEKVKASKAGYQLANREKVNAQINAWRKANPEAMRIICQNYRSRKRANGGTLSKGLAENLFKLQKGKCPCCHQPLGNDYHLDHIVPMALGGSNTDDNIQLLRATCNHQKHAKHPIDFMQQRGFLL